MDVSTLVVMAGAVWLISKVKKNRKAKSVPTAVTTRSSSVSTGNSCCRDGSWEYYESPYDMY